MNGYTEANKIDEKINSLSEKYPIEKNITEWDRLIRTIKTSVELLTYILLEEKEKKRMEKQNG